MLRKYERLEPYFAKCEFEANVLMKMPTAIEKQRINKLVKVLKELETASKKLQEDDPKNDLYFVRTLFDELINYIMAELDIDLSPKIGANASIVQDPDFENAVVKIQAGNEDQLTVSESLKVIKFSKPTSDDAVGEPTSDEERPNVSIVEREAQGIGREKKARVTSASRLN